MNEDEVIKELAQPILEKLKELEKEMGEDELIEIPRIELMYDVNAAPIEINGVRITEELLGRLEKYVQEELDAMRMPTILH